MWAATAALLILLPGIIGQLGLTVATLLAGWVVAPGPRSGRAGSLQPIRPAANTTSSATDSNVAILMLVPFRDLYPSVYMRFPYNPQPAQGGRTANHYIRLIS